MDSIAIWIHTHTLKNSVLFDGMQLPSILFKKNNIQELSQIRSVLLKYKITVSLKRSASLLCLGSTANSNHEGPSH